MTYAITFLAGMAAAYAAGLSRCAPGSFDIDTRFKKTSRTFPMHQEPNQPDLFGSLPAVMLPPIKLKPKPHQRERAEARRLAEQGAEIAAAKADRDAKGWKVAALSFFLAYCKKHGGEFQTEEVRRASKGHVHEPANSRAWGHVAMAAKKLNQIEWARFGTSADPKSHCAPSNVWRWIGERA